MWMPLVAIILTGGPGADTAEAQFKKMEQQVLKCKSLQTDLEVKATTDDDTLVDLKGRIKVAPANKVRIELNGQVNKEKDSMTMIANGTKMSTTSSKRPTKEQDAGKHLTEITLASFSRSGIMLALFTSTASSDAGEFDLDKSFKVSAFKLGKKEKIGGRETQAIDYTLKIKGSRDEVLMTVWIDAKSNLPVKRTGSVVDLDNITTFTETYSKTSLDAKIDAKEFTLTK